MPIQGMNHFNVLTDDVEVAGMRRPGTHDPEADAVAGFDVRHVFANGFHHAAVAQQ